jgi:adenine-specific DNA-methyltransferase
MLVRRTEALRQARQAAMDTGRSSAERNRLGQFATPPALAVEIAVAARELVGRGRVRFADPSIGTGSFFSAALTAFGRRRMASAYGVELDRAFVATARELWSGAGLEVVSGDFTRVVANGQCPASPDLILANPPYVRHHHLLREDKARLQKLVFDRTGVRVSGLAGLYVYFLLLATGWMADDGVAAWLIPSEWMDVNYGAALREYLTTRVTLERVHRFEPDDVQFGDALVSSVVVLFRKSPAPARHVVEFTRGGSVANPQAGIRVRVQELRSARKWTQLPQHLRRKTGGRGWTERSEGNPGEPTLGDLFQIRRGIATGCNGFFVLEREEVRRLGLRDEYVRPILPSPRVLKATVIESDADGYPQLDPQLCVIDCGLPGEEIRREHPALWRYLQSGVKQGVDARYLPRHRRPWYRQEQRGPAPFMCTYMGRGVDEARPFRFVWNKSHATATNVYLLLTPVGALAEMLRRCPPRAKIVHAMLNETTGDELRGAGRVYGGGLHKIEPRELGRVSARRLVERWGELRDGRCS